MSVCVFIMWIANVISNSSLKLKERGTLTVIGGSSGKGCVLVEESGLNKKPGML